MLTLSVKFPRQLLSHCWEQWRVFAERVGWNVKCPVWRVAGKWLSWSWVLGINIDILNKCRPWCALLSSTPCLETELWQMWNISLQMGILMVLGLLGERKEHKHWDNKENCPIVCGWCEVVRCGGWRCRAGAAQCPNPRPQWEIKDGVASLPDSGGQTSFRAKISEKY